MKRIRTIGLCLVAALAMSALAAGSASALEYKACAKGGSKEFSDKGCLTKVAPGTGKYGLGSAVGSTFKGKASKPLNQLVNLSKKVEGFFEAKGSKSEGTITGASTSEFVESFKKVKTNEGAACNSAGQGSGVIVTNKLGTALVPLGKGSGQGEVVFAAAGPKTTLATYECAGVTIKVFGAVIAEIEGLSGGASKSFGVRVSARGGSPGNLQEYLYPGGAGTEAEEEKADDFFENFVPKFKACVKEGVEPIGSGGDEESLSAAESTCATEAGTEFFVEEGEAPAKPDTLLSEIGPPISVTAPAAQNAKAAVKGKAAIKIV